MHCVDLGESFPTRIYLQNLASIQPRTSLVTFAVRRQIYQVTGILLAAAGAVVVLLAAGQAGPRPRDLLLGNLLLVLQCSPDGRASSGSDKL